MQRGFTLVELAIVLVIVGLLAGGIMAGQSLIRASELRSATTEFSRYVAAVSAFQDKHNGLPGDLPNATAYWPAATCPGTATQGTTDGTTCSGNGNGNIDANNETFRFWQHLALSGLIEGRFNGVLSDNAYWWSHSTVNTPLSRVPNGQWTTITYDNSAGGFTGNLYYYYLRGMLLLGGHVLNNWPYGGILSPEEVWNIDKKMDDGLPGRGDVLGTITGGCTSGNGAAYDGTYSLTSTARVCGVMFLNAY